MPQADPMLARGYLEMADEASKPLVSQASTLNEKEHNA
jgi:hypothetical protein